MNLRRNVRSWLLWLALLLPIAQAMADVHALSHVGDRQGDGLVHQVDCDLCLSAAHLGGSAPGAESGPLPQCPAVELLATAGPAPAVERCANWRPPARAPPAST